MNKIHHKERRLGGFCESGWCEAVVVESDVAEMWYVKA